LSMVTCFRMEEPDDANNAVIRTRPLHAVKIAAMAALSKANPTPHDRNRDTPTIATLPPLGNCQIRVR
jgi:hypothetical protein